MYQDSVLNVSGVVMLDKKASLPALKRLFHKDRVVDINALYRSLDTRSRMSVFRRLSLLDYLSSFTHKGRFYTLAHIPVFDSFGLWFFQGIGFARAGTLKEATVHLVESSEAGWTHKELADIFQVRVYNTLFDLAREQRLRCENVDFQRTLLYLSADPEKASCQRSRRRARSVHTHDREEVLFSHELVIDVLVEAVQAGEGNLDPARVARRLNQRGVPIPVERVTDVFRRFGLEKKLAKSLSKLSPR